MNLILKVVIVTILLIFTCDAFSSTRFRNVTITGAGVFLSGGKGILLININGDKSSMEECATTKRFAIDSNVPNYQEMVSLAMTAYISGQTNVDLYVTESCNSWGNAQDLRGIKMGTMPW
ncbi:hypothetical protein [Shewanella woodyi]|uniref:Uncharacterized protein n=1 Tax=Shewanella woodyi (strain ATCC 51908 / MS32) TaxID=392500 RepID=B1KKC5_SHEWM|nr:hypothetical protein [Shewanella woodyi]ACA85765.1 hypothetical protein Swoo_1477 [Shewanella woodyi ATCC 51908]